MSGARTARQVVKGLERRGWSVELGGGPFVTISTTVSARGRAIKNIEAAIRRAEAGRYDAKNQKGGSEHATAG